MTANALDTHQHAQCCKNCDTVTSGNYCHHCGQATHLHVPSAREFLHEFIAHYVALEGKLWRSLKLLLFKPGLLSREYIEGRRVRYIEPLRLYLTFSIIFFALFKMSGVEIINIGGRSDTPPALSAPAGVQPQKETEDSADFRELQDKTKRLLGNISPRLEQGAGRFFAMSPKDRNDTAKRVFFSYTPYAIFLMMPVFALYLKLLYLGTGRRYGEHFLFALHSNGFAFLMLSLFMLADGWNFVRFVLLAWLVFYLPTAMRRVYGGGRIMTALRWTVLMVLHLFTLVTAVSLAVAVGLLL
ncbi:DUF3667 domain-containing protein [Massilia sp. BSC265]|uniref:DUF3667 domain-containing protein n=1 Tax=Massilia sp. BSC265 TaxID=1549812 RepID=UPI0004E96822|nr:DUF3667 domain-containing protein [Massilia sp. BSC265]KFI06073.1 hypothetical protein JN27_18390 [Massilia sp. BSC265]